MRTRGSSKFGRRARRVSVVALAAATVATNSVPAEGVSASAPSGVRPRQADPFSCPPPIPVDELQVGEALHGLTVDQGTTPEPFNATVVGVIDDALAPGVPLLIAEASGNATIDKAGIWAGMSGSPVYIDTPAGPRLVGAVAYSFGGASPIAGITPATEMLNLLRGAGPAAAAPQVQLTDALERRIVAAGAATAQEAAAGLSRLPVPISVSGTSSARMRRVRRMIRRTVDGVRVYPAGRAGAAAATGLVAGGNVAAALSFGDVTAAGVGTVTAVCGDEALLFGHPFNWSGATRLSAHEASAVFVQADPVFGGFKVANIGEPVGTIDQDRLAGLHTELGPIPATTPIRSSFTATDSGASRASTTHAVLPEFISTAAAFHVFANLDRVLDRIGPGVVTLQWGARGRRADGRPWNFRRREKMADIFDVTGAAGSKVFVDLETLFSNPFEPITIDRVTVSGAVDTAYAEARLVRLERRVRGQWRTVDRRTPLQLVAGREVFLRAVVRKVRSAQLTRVRLSFVAPRWGGSAGSLTISAGAPLSDEFEEPTGPTARSFDQLLTQIDRAPTGDTVRAELRLARRVPGVGRQRLTRETRATAPTAVFGELGFEVEILPSRR